MAILSFVLWAWPRFFANNSEVMSAIQKSPTGKTCRYTRPMLWNHSHPAAPIRLGCGRARVFFMAARGHIFGYFVGVAEVFLRIYPFLIVECENVLMVTSHVSPVLSFKTNPKTIAYAIWAGEGKCVCYCRPAYAGAIY